MTIVEEHGQCPGPVFLWNIRKILDDCQQPERTVVLRYRWSIGVIDQQYLLVIRRAVIATRQVSDRLIRLGLLDRRFECQCRGDPSGVRLYYR